MSLLTKFIPKKIAALLATLGVVALLAVVAVPTANGAATTGRGFDVLTAPTSDLGQGYGVVSVVPYDYAKDFGTIPLTAEIYGKGTFSVNGRTTIDFTFDYTKTSNFTYQCVDVDTTVRVYPSGYRDSDPYPAVPAAHTSGVLPVACGGVVEPPAPVIDQSASIVPTQGDPSSVLVMLDNTKSTVETTFRTVIDGVKVAPTNVAAGNTAVIGPFAAPGKTVVVLGMDGTELVRYNVPAPVIDQSASIVPTQGDPSSVLVMLDNTKSTVETTFRTVIDGVKVAPTNVAAGNTAVIGPFAAPGKTVVVLGMDGTELARYIVPALPETPVFDQAATIVVDTTTVGDAKVELTNNGSTPADFVIRIDGVDETVEVAPNTTTTKNLTGLEPGATIIVIGEDGKELDRDTIPALPPVEQDELAASIVPVPDKPGTVTVDIDNSEGGADAPYQIIIDDEVVAEGTVPAGEVVTDLGPWTAPGSTIVVVDEGGKELDRAVIDDTGKSIRVCLSTGRETGPQYTSGELTVQQILDEEGDFFDQNIVPKFSYVKGGEYHDYPGLNYSTDNMAIMANDCVKNVFVEPSPGPNPNPDTVVTPPVDTGKGTPPQDSGKGDGVVVAKSDTVNKAKSGAAKSAIVDKTAGNDKQLALTGASGWIATLSASAVMLMLGALLVVANRRRKKVTE